MACVLLPNTPKNMISSRKRRVLTFCFDFTSYFVITIDSQEVAKVAHVPLTYFHPIVYILQKYGKISKPKI